MHSIESTPKKKIEDGRLTIKRAAFVACSLWLILFSTGGCAGKDFKWDDARKIHVGMTPDEVRTIIGPPNTISVRGDQTIWAWAHFNGWDYSTKSMAVVFKDGKVAEAPQMTSSNPNGIK